MNKIPTTLEILSYDIPLTNDEKKLLYVRNENFNRSGGILEFSTYFNAVSVNKIRQYTNVSRIGYRYETNVSVISELICYDDRRNETVIAKSCGCGFSCISVEVDSIPDNCILVYLRLKAVEEGANLLFCKVFYEGISLCQSPNIALITCTYKREKYIKRNARYIIENVRHNNLPFTLIVVDNGKSIHQKELPSEAVLIPNDNTGGSGGFAKGMQQASAMQRFTHFINMDDDISLDITSLQKLYIMLYFIKPEYADLSVSGAMLYLDKPCIQFECGGKFDTDNGKQIGYGYLTDLSEKDNIAENETPKDINYGGWWFMCMPIKYIDQGNLPLPFFIKYDDVEYALRCQLRIVTLNGICVWHEKFENKFNSSSVYYNTRNYLHLCSMYCKNFEKKTAKKFLRKNVIEHSCRQQYNMAQAVILGYSHYRLGMDYLYNINQEDIHIAVSKLNYDMFELDSEALGYSSDLLYEKYKQCNLLLYKKYMRIFIYGQIIPYFFCKKEICVTDAFFDRKELYWRRKSALHCNFSLNTGYMTKKSAITCINLMLKII